MRTCLPRRLCIHFATAIKYLSSTTCSQAGTRSQEFWRINHKENPDPENGNFSPYLTIEHLSNGICSDATTLLRRELLREQKKQQLELRQLIAALGGLNTSFLNPVGSTCQSFPSALAALTNRAKSSALTLSYTRTLTLLRLVCVSLVSVVIPFVFKTDLLTVST